MFDSPLTQFAIEAIREAALLARRIQRELVTPALTKEDRSPVTVADFAAQAVVARRLAERFPGTQLVGEESAEALRLAEGVETLERITHFVRRVIPNATTEDVCELIDRGAGDPPAEFWTLDPIDGTKGFLRREQYAVALALVRNGRVELGVLGCPELADGELPAPGGAGSLVAAAAGQGTWTKPLDGAGSEDWRRLTVSKRSRVAEARILRSVEKAHTNVDEIGRLAESLGITTPPVPLDSQAKYAVLAAGAGDVLVRLLSPRRPDYREKIWDQAAGSIVISEAGGRITDLDGRPLDFSHGRTLAANRGVLATNGPLHDALLAGLRSIGA
jgi:3'(2'), 5'-bisphosphate nucleotidase